MADNKSFKKSIDDMTDEEHDAAWDDVLSSDESKVFIEKLAEDAEKEVAEGKFTEVK